jgi:hypothetical protein
MKVHAGRKLFSSIMLVATVGLFCSTAIQVGFALNLHVPTVPLDITMKTAEALALPGLAARDWAAGTCIMFAMIGLLAIVDRFDRRTAHDLIGAILFLTLLPIIVTYFADKVPDGAGWIVFHHVAAGTLIFLTRPSAVSRAGSPR